MVLNFTNNTAERFASFFHNDPVYPFAYCLYQKMMEGHICLDLNGIYSVRIQDKEYKLEKETLCTSNYLTQKKDEVEPFFLEDGKLYLYKYYNYESVIVDYINAIHSNESLRLERVSKLDTLDDLEVLLDSFGDLTVEKGELIDWQFIATIKAFIQPFSIITGGPGTGKTTTIAKLLTLLGKENSSLKIALAAPTGKAAVRMKEALFQNPIFKTVAYLFPDVEAMTIHRLLGSIKDSHYFKHNQDNKLEEQIIILDEASMIDLPLMSKLLLSLKESSRLILLGDQNQLSSVGAGSLLKDLCENVLNLSRVSEEVKALLENKLPAVQLERLIVEDMKSHLQDNVTELQFSRRFSSESNIGKLSKAILQSNFTSIINNGFSVEGKDIVIIDSLYDEQYIDDMVTCYLDYIQEKDIGVALQSLNKNRVLCAVKETEQGVYALNRIIEKKLISKGVLVVDSLFYNNRPIMITKNNAELNIYNGDVGIIRNGKAYFDVGKEQLLEIQPGLLSDYETVFAMTIHKSQGSEFDSVVVVLPKSSDNKLLTKQLLYTGITRAKKKVVLQGNKEVIEMCLQNEVNRISGITNRLVRL